MNQQEQTPSTSRNRKRNRNRKNGTSHGFALKGKGSSIPLAVQEIDKQKNIIGWGKNNLYPYFLNYLFDNNPIHSGIISSKQYYTTSGGLVYEGIEQEQWKAFFNNNKSDPNEQNLQEVVEDFSLDMEKSNMFVGHVILTSTGERKFRRLKVIPFEKVRFEVIEVDKVVKLTNNILISEDWSAGQVESKRLSPYSPLDEEQKEFFFLYMVKPSQSLDRSASKNINPSFYPKPPYNGAITQIDTGIKIGQHGNAEINNNFSIGTILAVNNGKPANQPDQDAFEQDVANATTGVDATGGTLVVYSNGKEREPSVLNLNGNNLPERYLNVKKSGEESIIHAHSVVSPTLFGIMQEGSFNADQLEQGYAIMQGNYFASRRKAILTYINWLGKTFFGLTNEIKFGENPLNLPKPETNPQFVVNVDKKEELAKEKTDKILERLKSCGTDKSKFRVLGSYSFVDNSEVYETKMISDFVKSMYADLPDNVARTLDLINQGESFNSIRTALDISGVELAGIYQQLQKLGMISTEGKVLAKGVEQLVASDIESMEILYEYALKPNAPKLIGESREFCKTLISLNRLYTRDEINFISLAEGYNVFDYRGGWYHNPDTDTNQPSCRHEWKQTIVFNK